GRINLREDSGLSLTEIPAASSKGMVSSKMRPLESAIVNISLSSLDILPTQSFNLCSQPFQFYFHLLIATIKMVNPVDDGFTTGRQSGNDQTGRCTQIGCHDLGTKQLRDAINHG